MTSPPSELEAAIDELYQRPVAEFTEARNALSAARKAAGDKDGAARVKGLVKPGVVAWAVNQVYFQDRERFDALVAVMTEVAAAQRGALAGSGAAQLREATRRKSELLQDVARAAERRLVDSGGAGGLAVLQRLTATLEALLREAESRGAAARAEAEGLEMRLVQARARAEEKTAAEADARRVVDGLRAGLTAAESALAALTEGRSGS
jgi:hypothetical protein